MTTAQAQIGRYALLDELGRGGTGVVHRAQDPAIGRTVAIKVLHAAQGLTPRQRDAARERFSREARTAGNLDHPNIVRIFDVGEDEGGRLYLVMEYISGPSLEQVVERRKLGPAEISELLSRIGSALDAAHAHGIIHRDVKPANILLTSEGTPKIADFGVAQMTDSHLTQDMRYLGTPATMSPEQVEGKPLDNRADLFSLGVLAYRLLTRKSPFEGRDAVSLAYQTVHVTPPPVSEVDPALPRALDFVVAKMLAKDPAERYASGREFHEAFESCLGPSIPGVSTPGAGFAKPPSRAMLPLLVVLLTITIALYGLNGRGAAAPLPVVAAPPAPIESPAGSDSGSSGDPATAPRASASATSIAKESEPAPSAPSPPPKPPAKAVKRAPAPVPAPPGPPVAVEPLAAAPAPAPPIPAELVDAQVTTSAPSGTAEATIAIRHAISQGTLTVYLDGKTIFSDEFSKKKWVPLHTTQWSGLLVPSGEHELTAEVTAADGKTFRSEPFTTGFEDGKVTTVRISFKDGALVFKRKDR